MERLRERVFWGFVDSKNQYCCKIIFSCLPIIEPNTNSQNKNLMLASQRRQNLWNKPPHRIKNTQWAWVLYSYSPFFTCTLRPACQRMQCILSFKHSIQKCWAGLWIFAEIYPCPHMPKETVVNESVPIWTYWTQHNNRIWWWWSHKKSKQLNCT